MNLKVIKTVREPNRNDCETYGAYEVETTRFWFLKTRFIIRYYAGYWYFYPEAILIHEIAVKDIERAVDRHKNALEYAKRTADLKRKWANEPLSDLANTPL